MCFRTQIILDVLKDQTFYYLHGRYDFYCEVAQYNYSLKGFDNLKIFVFLL